jgi:Flp pilus assembly protein TadD
VTDTLGLALIAKGLYLNAISELRGASEKLPKNPTILYHLGLAHWKNGEKDEALEVLMRALKMKKDFPERKEAQRLLEKIRAETT